MEEIKDLPQEIENNNSIIDFFKDEEGELNNAIAEIDTLYDEVKQHYDQLKLASKSANGGRGILTFIQNQTSNLVALKNSKATLINNKITMKKYAAELALKQKKESGESAVNNEIVNAIMEKLEKDDENIIYDSSYDENDNSSISSEDELLDRRVKQLIDEGAIVEDEPDFENVNLAVAIKDKKWHFVGIDELGKIVKGFPVPEKSEYKIHLEKDDNGSTIAVDQDDKVYAVVRLKSKKKKSHKQNKEEEK